MAYRSSFPLDFIFDQARGQRDGFDEALMTATPRPAMSKAVP